LAAAVAVSRCSIGMWPPHTAVLGRLGVTTATGSVRGDVGVLPDASTLVGDSDGQGLRPLPSGRTWVPLNGCGPVSLVGCLCLACSGLLCWRASDSTQSRCMKWSRLARTGCFVRMVSEWTDDDVDRAGRTLVTVRFRHLDYVGGNYLEGWFRRKGALDAENAQQKYLILRPLEVPSP
jgi:hypothetical protein